MSDEKAIKIIQRYEKLNSERNSTWNETWDKIGRYIQPRKDYIYTKFDAVKGEERHWRIYDSSAIHASELLASALHSMLTNPTLNWFQMSSGDPEIDSAPGVRDWLQKLTDRMHQLMNNSNFHTAIHEVYMDLTSFATGPMRIDEDADFVFRFKSMPVFTITAAENHLGEIDTVFTEDAMTVRQIIQKWGEEVISSNQATVKLLKDLDKEVKVIHAVYPREDFMEGNPMPKRLPIASFHVLKDEKVLLHEGGFNEMPYVVPRWSKCSGEVYGRGPAHKALPDVMMLNAVMKDYIRASQKRTDPPTFMEDDSIIGPVRFTPGGLNFIRPGANPPFQLNYQGDLNSALAMSQELRNRLKEHFYITQLQLREGPQMTATEVNQRTEENLRILSPVLGRLHFELLQPTAARCFGIMSRRNLLPAGMPEELRARTPEVIYTSQIAKAQKVTEAINLTRSIEIMIPVGQIDPTSLDVLNTDNIIRHVGSLYGIPEKLFRKNSEVKGIRQQRLQQQEQQQAMQEQAMSADSVGKLQ